MEVVLVIVNATEYIEKKNNARAKKKRDSNGRLYALL